MRGRATAKVLLFCAGVLMTLPPVGGCETDQTYYRRKKTTVTETPTETVKTTESKEKKVEREPR